MGQAELKTEYEQEFVRPGKGIWRERETSFDSLERLEREQLSLGVV